ncbi:MAG: T9SS type A sorting domain-containing protein [Bacteroidota bacterium]
MKKILFVFYCIAIYEVSYAQVPASFYLNVNDPYAKCYFTSDNIYFTTNNLLTKADYSGNIIWTKSGSFYKLAFSNEAIYCLAGGAIIKCDTSGNVIWARNISASVCPLQNGNYVYYDGLVLHKDRIHISSVQLNSTTGNQGYNGMITLDTSGSLVAAWCDPNSWSSSLGMISSGFGSYYGGGWFIFRHGGVGIEENIVKMNYDGTIDTMAISIYLDMGVSVMTQDIIALSDSNYLAICNTDPNNGMGLNVDYHAGLSKFDESGNVIWQKLIFASSDTGFSVYGATSDSLANIYLVGNFGGDTFQGGIFLMKLDVAGNVIFMKEWSGNAWGVHFYPGNIFYKDGSICSYMNYLDGGQYKAGILVFDTNFSACNIPNLQISLPIHNDPIYLSGWPSYPAVPYMVLSDTFATAIAIKPVANDLCLLLTSKELNEHEVLDILPNPFRSEFKIVTGVCEKYLVIIHDLLGKKIFEKEYFSDAFEISIPGIPKGIYEINIRSTSKNLNRKIVKI